MKVPIKNTKSISGVLRDLFPSIDTCAALTSEEAAGAVPERVKPVAWVREGRAGKVAWGEEEEEEEGRVPWSVSTSRKKETWCADTTAGQPHAELIFSIFKKKYL